MAPAIRKAALRLQGDLRSLHAGQTVRPPIDVLTGFTKDSGNAMGRPVGVAIDTHGALLVADDVGNTVWRVAGSASRVAADVLE